MKKILLYEVIKLVGAFGAGVLLFTLLPVSVYVVLLPLDLVGWWLIRSRISAGAWIGISIAIYLFFIIFTFSWIQAGHSGLEFLLDLNWLWM